nr:putative reverse transcriptase domain, aspartic peptidase domain protein [Tanacetum cinerariifolium]
HLQKDCKKNTAASTSGQANKKPGASGHIFAITKDHATKTSGKSMQIISALQARTLLSHGCKGFLATIHDTTSDVSSIHDQPIVSEFLDVFPNELPGIPPVREVEFSIELILGAEPI